MIKIMETEPEVLLWQSLKILSLQPVNKSKVPWISFHYEKLTWGIPVFDIGIAWKGEK